MKRLKQLRVEKGLSQARLAARAELDPSTVNQIERGARDASTGTLRKLADALEVSLYELMEEESPKAQAPLPLDRGDDRGTALDTLQPLLSYMEQRAREQEEELEEENNPYFRSIDTAARWLEAVNKEARGLSGLLIEEAKPNFRSMTDKEKGLASVDLLRYIAKLYEVRNKADKRIAEMVDKPNEVDQRRGDKAQGGVREADREAQILISELLEATG